jgi:hypothetical protein
MDALVESSVRLPEPAVCTLAAELWITDWSAVMLMLPSPASTEPAMLTLALLEVRLTAPIPEAVMPALATSAFCELRVISPPLVVLRLLEVREAEFALR